MDDYRLFYDDLIKYPEKMKSIMDSLEVFVKYSQENSQKEI